MTEFKAHYDDPVGAMRARDARIAELETRLVPTRTAIDAAIFALEDRFGPDVHTALMFLKTARDLCKPEAT